MNKARLFDVILSKLKSVHQVAVDSAQRAYETATAEENEAENKYDTFGLEASYLAHGQSRRVAQCEADVIAFEKIPRITFENDMPASSGALVHLHDEQARSQYVFLSPVSGGLNVQLDKKDITLVTSSSPLGKALSGCFIGDEITLKMGGEIKRYEVLALY